MIKSPGARLVPVLLCGLFAGGCKTVPVVPHAVHCDVNGELLTSKCAEPRQMANDATYAALVDTMQADRKALRECSATVNALRDTIRRCNQATDEYNKKIDAVNGAK